MRYANVDGLGTAFAEAEERYLEQEAYCEQNQLPIFIPRSGICPACGRNIWNERTKKYAGKMLVTCCGACGFSFVE